MNNRSLTSVRGFAKYYFFFANTWAGPCFERWETTCEKWTCVVGPPRVKHSLCIVLKGPNNGKVSNCCSCVAVLCSFFINKPLVSFMGLWKFHALGRLWLCTAAKRVGSNFSRQHLSNYLAGKMVWTSLSHDLVSKLLRVTINYGPPLLLSLDFDPLIVLELPMGILQKMHSSKHLCSWKHYLHPSRFCSISTLWSTSVGSSFLPATKPVKPSWHRPRCGSLVMMANQ